MSALGDRVRAAAQYRGSVEDVARAVELVEAKLEAATRRAEAAEADARSNAIGARDAAATAATAIERLQLATTLVDAARLLRDDPGGGTPERGPRTLLFDALQAHDDHVRSRS